MLLVSSRSMPRMNTVAVDSSALAQVAYDKQHAILRVEFPDGAIYQYLGVPPGIYQDLLRADSKGAYFNHYIRSRFPYAILPGAVSAPPR
ncbi:MAG: KTSC domain-containing protein [Burkholderiales bacterium]